MAEEGQQVVGCHTLDTWTQQLDTAKEQNKLIVVDFTASWCGPCRFIAPIFADLAKRTANAIFLKVDVDEMPTIAEQFGVQAMPTFLIFKDGEIVHTIVGAKKDELVQKVGEFSTAIASSTAPATTTTTA